MFSLLNPTTLLAVIFVIMGAFGYGRHYEHLEQQAEIARLNAVMAEEANTASNKFKQEQQDAQKTITKLRADINSGAVRLSIPISSSCGSTSGSTEERAELDTKVSQDLISITEDGDNAIRELNYCIDRYNQIRNVK
jgi:hypothetical protein